MSLIFQSLQKPPTDGPVQGTATQQGAAAVASASPVLLVWMRPILIGLALVLALGCGVVYAVQYLKDRLPSEAVAGDIRPTSAPATVAVRRPIHVPPAMTPEPVPAMTDAAVGQTRFYPPETQTPRETTTEAAAPIAMVTPERDAPTTPVEVSTPELPPASAVVEFAPGQVSTDSSMVDYKTTEFEAERQAALNARRESSEARARIGRLVGQIEEAIAGGGKADLTEDLLERLARIKGHDHPYVAKLRAYWHLKRERYASAQSDLQKVIAANPDDLEAGINMALIEIHERQYAPAMDRLKRLRQAHPESSAVADLIKRLR